MKNPLIIVLCLFSVFSFGQKKQPALNLKNVLVIGKMDKADDRYTVEASLTEMLTNAGVKAVPSLNILKIGNDAQLLATDSIQNIVKSKGIDTYVIISVRGYDRRFKRSEVKLTFEEVLDEGSLFDIYKSDLVSVSFEFKFFRNNELIYTDIVKCGNISDRDSVVKRFRKKVGKRIEKSWL
jgi:hypothetical protein